MGRLDALKSNNPFRHAGTHSGPGSGSGPGTTNVDDVAPPPGPPPSYNASTSGPPADDFAPPPGPPPSHDQPTNDFAPPPGPPPSHGQQPQHNWQAVPLPEDTSSYPPPPDIFTGHNRSWTNNATEAQAAEGERWCARYPLLRPLPPPHHPPFAVGPRLLAPNANTFDGTVQASTAGAATFLVRTTRRSGDSCATAQPAVYLALRDDPRRAGGRMKTIYFEARMLSDASGESGSVAVGFTALPYPPFRMPGWHRGSLAVHSDDGHRYVNDRWGGVDFVEPWGKRGTVVGVGMRFSASSSSAAAGGGMGGSEKGKGVVAGGGGSGGGGIDVECFFTRDGRVVGSWDVNGERDAQADLEPVGVQGFHDLVPAVGMFQSTEVEVILDPARWLFRGAEV